MRAVGGIARARSGSPFEDEVGFCRALRVGDRLLVAGTAPVWPDGTVSDDPSVQTARCFEIVAGALSELGAGLSQVVRTRLYIVDRDDAEAVGQVHARLFGANPPVATMVVVAGLLDERWRVEVEAEAIAL